MIKPMQGGGCAFDALCFRTYGGSFKLQKRRSVLCHQTTVYVGFWKPRYKIAYSQLKSGIRH